ncbi:Uncharacterised protein [Vibrio cholerae]|nr:Uncharacterised protein [Vibrio cholerae]
MSDENDVKRNKTYTPPSLGLLISLVIDSA